MRGPRWWVLSSSNADSISQLRCAYAAASSVAVTSASRVDEGGEQPERSSVGAPAVVDAVVDHPHDDRLGVQLRVVGAQLTEPRAVVEHLDLVGVHVGLGPPQQVSSGRCGLLPQGTRVGSVIVMVMVVLLGDQSYKPRTPSWWTLRSHNLLYTPLNLRIAPPERHRMAAGTPTPNPNDAPHRCTGRCAAASRTSKASTGTLIPVPEGRPGRVTVPSR